MVVIDTSATCQRELFGGSFLFLPRKVWLLSTDSSEQIGSSVLMVPLHCRGHCRLSRTQLLSYGWEGGGRVEENLKRSTLMHREVLLKTPNFAVHDLCSKPHKRTISAWALLRVGRSGKTYGQGKLHSMLIGIGETSLSGLRHNPRRDLGGFQTAGACSVPHEMFVVISCVYK
eukprot:5342406-Amphidinium_carterae.3